MRAAWRPRAPLPRAAPRAAPALAPRARESFAARRPGRTDLGTAPCASPRRRRPFPAALARPGAPRATFVPSPGSGRPAGTALRENLVATAEKPAPRPLARRQPPRRPLALSPERVRGVRVGGPRGAGRGPGAALRSGGSAQPASALAAAKAHRCPGEGGAGGATSDRH